MPFVWISTVVARRSLSLPSLSRSAVSRPERTRTLGGGAARRKPNNLRTKNQEPLQLLILRPPAPFRRHPRDHLVGIHDVARLAVEAVGEVEERDAAAAVGGGL